MEANKNRVPSKMSTGGLTAEPSLPPVPSVNGPVPGPPGGAGPIPGMGPVPPGKESIQMFGHRIASTITGAYQTLSLAAGYKLGLITNLCNYEGTPKTTQEIADDAGLKERYVREWMGAMVTGNIVEQDEDGKFFLPPHRAMFFQTATEILLLGTALPMQCKVFNEVLACCQKDGPSGVSYDHYSDFHHFMSSMSNHWWGRHLYSAFLPSIPGLEEQLESGISVMDVGCGEAGALIMLAERFPKSRFLGIDLVAAPIKYATAAIMGKNLSNISFKVMDAHDIPVDEWAESYEYVLASDSLHDMAHPTEVVRIINKILTPEGRFSVVEVNAHSEIKQNKEMPFASTFYTNSLFHCMTVSLHAEGGEGCGNMWGRENAEAALKEGGFKILAVHTPSDWFNVHYLCGKS